MFMGHKGAGSHTGARYTHRRPEYLRDAAASVEALYAALRPYVHGRALRGECVASAPLELLQVIDAAANAQVA
jgi:hypothetical protein